jgi:ribosome-binding protein aMBF1 (putative translation factor)
MNEQAELIRFGEAFRRAREWEGLSVADLAARTGIGAASDQRPRGWTT